MQIRSKKSANKGQNGCVKNSANKNQNSANKDPERIPDCDIIDPSLVIFYCQMVLN